MNSINAKGIVCHFVNSEICARKALCLNVDAPYGNMALGWISLQK